MNKYPTLEAQADSLDAARSEVRSKVPPGHVVINEAILNDGLPKTARADAPTVAKAFEKARADIPANATVQKEEIVRQPSQESLEVVAFDEEEARRKAAVRYPRTIQSISVTQEGRRGFLGMGRRPTTFAVLVVQTAEVQITYRLPASIRAATATADMIPSLKISFWERGGPIQREALYEEQRCALAGLSAFAVAGDPTATAEIRSIIEMASQALLDIRQFSTYHGYQRQQVAAEILGIAGSTECIPTLEEGLRLQQRYAGSSQYCNRTSTQPLVEGTIHKAIARLRSSGRSASEAKTFDTTSGAAPLKQGTLTCPKCGTLIPGEIPETGMCICAGCKAVLMIDNYKISS